MDLVNDRSQARRLRRVEHGPRQGPLHRRQLLADFFDDKAGLQLPRRRQAAQNSGSSSGMPATSCSLVKRPSTVRNSRAGRRALDVPAAQLANRPERTITQFAAQLLGGDRLDSLALVGDEQSHVRAVFELSYVRLDETARRLFRLLGAAPTTDLTPGCAAALLGCGVAEAAATLGRLAAAHLVTAHQLGRYDCHDLLRAFALEHSRREDSPAERQEALFRLCAWYLARIEEATDLVNPDSDRIDPSYTSFSARYSASEFADTAQASAWLRAENSNLIAVCRHAAEHGPGSSPGVPPAPCAAISW